MCLPLLPDNSSYNVFHSNGKILQNQLSKESEEFISLLRQASYLALHSEFEEWIKLVRSLQEDNKLDRAPGFDWNFFVFAGIWKTHKQDAPVTLNYSQDLLY